jgi:DNA-binding IclR family transcriptional regulator
MSVPEAWHVARTLRTMELLATRPRSAPELADALGVHVRTARRVLTRLESEGYVTVTEDRRRRYRPTMRVVALAGLVMERAELTAVAVPQWRLRRRCSASAPWSRSLVSRCRRRSPRRAGSPEAAHRLVGGCAR